ncbi:FxDxF family PEP-CTERM protein [uncultured Sphingomonas sp.]|uniref:FxDxF family PEP-CTERM protein n=1 Tax=uncultured Sphingomonas sp. TaxID=158754 RepID=UPI0035C9D95A
MTRIAYTALASGLAIAVAAPAAAAPFINIDTGSGSFGNPQLSCTTAATPCAFSDTLTFTTPVGFNLASLTISSSIVGNDASTDVNFGSVTLNGIAFNTILTGATEFRNLLNQTLVAGATNTLVVSGLTGTNGSYGGSVSFGATTPAVPEAATWAMMIGGLGAVGVVIRRRKAMIAVA